MILKWLSLEGHWHLKDNATDVADMGWMTVSEAREIAQKYGGPEAYLTWHLDSTNEDVEDPAKRYHYVIATIHGERYNILLSDTQFFVLSDQGKTIDKF